jgi:hypothetical protein
MRSAWLCAMYALAFVGCATGGGPGDGDGGMDAGMGEGDAGSIETDSGVRGEGLVCEVCETSADCAVDHYCAPLTTGGSVCLARCNIDLPDCAPRFECVMNFTASIPFPVCAPVGERCCVDFDGDLHGTGVGCLGTDCNDDDMTVNSSASETCDGLDNDCNDTIDDGDQDVLCPRADHVAASGCAGGMCEIAECEPNFADCNRTAADGCEVSTTGSTDCGMCGTPCVIPNGTPDCSGGACRVGTCDVGFGDCNGMAADGCEEPLNSTTHCGACGNGCDLPRASESCVTGTCEVTTCDSGYGNCDATHPNGCETSTRTNADCGSCDVPCDPTNATGDCSTGVCQIFACDPGYGDCDFNRLSCESRLNTNTNCGGCGSSCNIPNAVESCSGGSCNFVSCNSNFSNCDFNNGNGCELSHAAVSGACGSNDLGTEEGDLCCGQCNFDCCGCCSNPENLFATRTGRTSTWYKMRYREGSDYDTAGRHRVTLQSPGGVDYDLYVYRACGGALIGSSTAGAGALDSVTINVPDNFTVDDSFDYYIEVRHFGGAACADWTLNVYGRDC